jgi:predicted polyphosphate/ATP-dependent NAD kinase
MLVEKALAGGAPMVSPARAQEALEVLAAARDEIELLTYPAPMGEEEAQAAGFEPILVGSIGGRTSAADTRKAAGELAGAGVELILLAGGDGTAVDVFEAIGDRVALIGVPAGVKMHSAVFAVNPRGAGRLALDVVRGRARELADAEIMDIDEEALRAGSVSPRLCGYAKVPFAPSLVQTAKARSAAGERAAQEEIAQYVSDRVLGDDLCLIGPGTTTRAIMAALGLEKTVLGVDVVRAGVLVAKDADERTLLGLVPEEGTKVVVTPIGGQGFLFGRGNQQLSAEVLRRVGSRNVVVVATDAKLAALGGRPLLVDTGEAGIDEALAGYVRVVTGYNRETVYRIAA